MPQIIAEKKLLRESSAQIRIICGRKEVFCANKLVDLWEGSYFSNGGCWN
jgi:hypothetical protein